MKTMVTGTAWFPTLHAAVQYYTQYGDDRASVENKISERSIHIGNPPKQSNEVRRWIQDRRWHIETKQD